MRTLFIDIDGSICRTNGTDYEGSQPIPEAIIKINKAYDSGNTIVYWTSRGALKSGQAKDDIHILTRQQLNMWGCYYHELRFDKPLFDLLIDDKAQNASILTDRTII